MMNDERVIQIARQLRDGLVAHAKAHIDAEQEAVGLVGLVDELLQRLTAGADAPGPLRLAWPTNYQVVTQTFGKRPEFYRKFGLPGHEGVDIRAPEGSPVYACADGEVVMAGWHPKRGKGHAYGVQVRIRHKRSDGEYETIYAHLMDGSLKVASGQRVVAGQLLGLADHTGNVQGDHLHLTLKKIGATNGGYGELIDPEPYFTARPEYA